ncbi:autotransporter outer membrane beta-barrel domain-containing protein [Pseudomonas sp. Marseille-P9899]|uniref:autotransporter outer membrane beta-barrel domain-containing protein n=1 Tax=Pseudomonas sp. Marseille-P9899 TaxID=2730401 RepID=UPI002113DBC5|nr:autotransporter outer membrane beta-barrel domain-containing protein [Pseudomonas sp. Marseille-P9899]
MTHSSGRGLTLGTDGATREGSHAQVSNSSITGTAAAVLVSTESTLNLLNTDLVATGANSSGLVLLSGTASAQGGSITGVEEGITVRSSGGTAAGSLVLSGTRVTGQNGSAIELTGNSTTTVDILNGTTLSAGNGTIIDVLNASTATVNVGQSNLTGNLKVSGNSTGNFTFDNGGLTGDFIVEQGGTGTLALNNGSLFTGRMENVQDASIDSTSHWMMTGDSSVTNLNMNGGRVTLGDTDSFYTLNLETLSGNGTFVMGSNFANNETDFINITGEAAGNHDLLISASGTDPAAGVPLQVVHTGGGGAQFSLLGGAVDLGAYSYSLKQEGDDWFLDPETRTISPGTKTVMALSGTAPTVFYGELTTLRTRMGELRYSEGRSAGVWMRAHSNQYNVADASSGVGYTQNQQGMSFGADAPLPWGDGQWLIGALAGYSKSDLNLSHGSSGTIDSYYLGGYATWLDAKSGYYVDTVIKYNRYQNDAKVGLSDGTRAKGDYDNHGIGGSVEVGRHIKLKDNYFVEPFAQIAGTVIQSKDYRFSNDMEADSGATRSLLGKAGATVGKTIHLDEGRILQPYLKAALAHEFASNNKVKVNENSFNNDLSGSRGELGAGVALSLSRDFQVHADFEYSNGKNIEMPYSMNVGLRYLW